MFWNTIVVLLSTGGLIGNQSTTKKLKRAKRLFIVELLSTAWSSDNQTKTIKQSREEEGFIVESLSTSLVVDNQSTMEKTPLIPLPVKKELRII